MSFPAARGAAIRLAAFYAVTFAIFGINLPYWPVWLRSRGFDDAAIGVLVAVATAVRLVAQPIAGHVGDRSGERKRPIIVASLIMTLSFALYFVAEGFWQFLVVAVLFGLFASPIVSLTDTLTMQGVRQGGFAYGRVRLWGSLSFMLVAWGLGLLLDIGSADWIRAGMMLACLVSCVVAFALPDWRFAPERRGGRAPLRALLADRSLLIFIAATGAGQASHAVYYAFGTLHWRAAGLGDGFIGFLWALGVIAEILFFAWGDRLLRRFGTARVLMASGAAGMVRWGALAVTADPLVLMAVQVLHALTFAAGFQTAVLHLARAVPAERAASAQSLNSVIGSGILLGGALALSGPLYHALGGHAYVAMAALSAVTGGYGLLLARRAI
jgi:PPP family 3-phenylpropionic acid transporter